MAAIHPDPDEKMNEADKVDDQIGAAISPINSSSSVEEENSEEEKSETPTESLIYCDIKGPIPKLTHPDALLGGPWNIDRWHYVEALFCVIKSPVVLEVIPIKTPRTEKERKDQFAEVKTRAIRAMSAIAKKPDLKSDLESKQKTGKERADRVVGERRMGKRKCRGGKKKDVSRKRS